MSNTHSACTYHVNDTIAQKDIASRIIIKYSLSWGLQSYYVLCVLQSVFLFYVLYWSKITTWHFSRAHEYLGKSLLLLGNFLPLTAFLVPSVVVLYDLHVFKATACHLLFVVHSPTLDDGPFRYFDEWVVRYFLIVFDLTLSYVRSTASLILSMAYRWIDEG